MGIQPSEIDAMPYYEWQWLVDDLQEYLEEQQKAHKDTAKQSSQDKQFKQMQQQMVNQQRSMMPKFEMPKMPQAFDFLK